MRLIFGQGMHKLGILVLSGTPTSFHNFPFKLAVYGRLWSSVSWKNVDLNPIHEIWKPVSSSAFRELCK